MNLFRPLIASAIAALVAMTPTAYAVPNSVAETACTTQTPPVMPRAAVYVGTPGVVHVRASVRDGRVRDIEFISGPRMYHSAIREAMSAYRCEERAGEWSVIQEFSFDPSISDIRNAPRD